MKYTRSARGTYQARSAGYDIAISPESRYDVLTGEIKRSGRWVLVVFSGTDLIEQRAVNTLAEGKRRASNLLTYKTGA